MKWWWIELPVKPCTSEGTPCRDRTDYLCPNCHEFIARSNATTEIQKIREENESLRKKIETNQRRIANLVDTMEELAKTNHTVEEIEEAKRRAGWRDIPAVAAILRM